MSRRITAGNDAPFRWAVKLQGKPFDLSGKDVKVYVINSRGEIPVARLTIEGNEVSGVFEGRYQTRLGEHSLVLRVNEGRPEMKTAAVANVFELVQWSTDAGGSDEGDVIVAPVLIESELSIGMEGGGGGSYDDTELRNAIADLKESDIEQNDILLELRDRIEENEVLIEDLQNTKIDKEADDYYPQLAVGLADNLSGVDVVDSEVNFRRSGGGAISDGVARIEAIKGNSVVWNQLYPTGWSFTREGITSTSQNNIITANGTLTTTYFANAQFVGNEVNHKYLFIVEGLSSALNGANFSLQNRPDSGAVISNGFAYFFYDNSDPSLGRNIGFSRLTSGTVISETYIFRQIDLTKMFGAGNEPTTIEEFYSRIPMGVDLNAYNEGEVIHMDVQSIESQGVNAWDEEWEKGTIADNTGALVNSENTIRSKNYIKVIGGQEYRFAYFGSAVTWERMFYYDSDKALLYSAAISVNKNFTPPSNCAYIKFRMGDNYGATYKNDICINLSDTAINGKYFPYVKRTEDLSIIRKYFPQGMKSAGSAHDEIRYNKETNRWEAVKRIGEVDMGSRVVSPGSIEGLFSFPVDGMNLPITYDDRKSGILCSRYTTSNDAATATMYDKSMLRFPDGTVYIKDTSYTDAASFKAAMQGVILYYELAEPIVTELDAEDQFKDLDYQVWNCGTEKAIAEGKSAPLAADITYGFNAIGKIKELESLVAALRAKVGI